MDLSLVGFNAGSNFNKRPLPQFIFIYAYFEGKSIFNSFTDELVEILNQGYIRMYTQMEGQMDKNNHRSM